jgi:hypothetical protein
VRARAPGRSGNCPFTTLDSTSETRPMCAEILETQFLRLSPQAFQPVARAATRPSSS